MVTNRSPCFPGLRDYVDTLEDAEARALLEDPLPEDSLDALAALPFFQAHGDLLEWPAAAVNSSRSAAGRPFTPTRYPRPPRGSVLWMKIYEQVLIFMIAFFHDEISNGILIVLTGSFQLCVIGNNFSLIPSTPSTSVISK